MIRKLIYTALATTLLATPALTAPKSKAVPRDLLLVILKQEVNARDGAHKLLVERDQCMKFLEGVRSRFNKGEPVTLTLVDPAATGNVVSASCVHPNGTTTRSNWASQKLSTANRENEFEHPTHKVGRLARPSIRRHKNGRLSERR